MLVTVDFFLYLNNIRKIFEMWQLYNELGGKIFLIEKLLEVAVVSCPFIFIYRCIFI